MGSKEEKSNLPSTEKITNDSVKNEVVPVEKQKTSPPKEDSVAVEEMEPTSSNEPKGKMMGTVEHSPEVQKLLDAEKSKAGVGYLEQKAAEKKEKEKKAAELKAQKKAAEKFAAEQKLAEKKLAEEKKAAEEAMKAFEKKEKKKM